MNVPNVSILGNKGFWNRRDGSIKIKVCNIKNLDLASEVAELGVDALGFHIWKKSDISARVIQFRNIIRFLPRSLSCWLLTDIRDDSLLKEIINKVGFDTIQIQGKVPFEELRQMMKEFRRMRLEKGLMVVKTVSVDCKAGYEYVLKIAENYAEGVDGLLLDSKRNKRWGGGTGCVHNWNLSAKLVRNIAKPVILAGGLTAMNVQEAIRRVKPYGVDVETGVEVVVGKYKGKGVKCKYVRKIQEFVSRAKGYQSNLRCEK